MVIKLFWISSILLLFSLFSCNTPKDNEKDKDLNCYSWEIKNKELRDQIVQYFNTVDASNDPGDVLFIRVLDEPPNVKYFLYYANGISVVRIGQVHIITEVEGKKVCISFERKDPSLNDFKLSDESLIKFMKNNFPEDYQYYKSAIQDFKRDSSFYKNEFQFRDALPVPSTWAPESWELTFKNGEMIDKKIKL
jgi:hypothetical protein